MALLDLQGMDNAPQTGGGGHGGGSGSATAARRNLSVTAVRRHLRPEPADLPLSVQLTSIAGRGPGQLAFVRGRGPYEKG